MMGWSCGDHMAEIVYLLFKIGESLIEPSIRLFIYQTVCVEVYSNSTERCFNLSHKPTEESNVESAAADYMIIYKVLMNCPAIVLGFFCGAWSDVIGRKVPVLLTLAATVLADLMCLLSMSGGWSKPPSLSLVMIGAAIRGGFGKSAVITMALYSYTCDESVQESRTKKIGQIMSMNYFGYFVGSLLAGALLQGYGFGIIFTLVAIFNLACIAMVVFFMKGREESDDSVDKYGKFPFRVVHIQQSIKVLIKDRHHRSRLHVILLFCVVFIYQATKAGELHTTLLLVESPLFSWPKYMYGYLLAVDYITLGLVVLFLLPILINYLQLKDMQLVLTGIAFQVLRLVILAFSGSTLGVYFSSLAGCPSVLVLSCTNAIISKTVDPGEMGKAFSLLSCAETVAQLVGVVIFNSVYQSTREILQGFTFAIEAIFFVLLFGALVLLGRDMKLAAQSKILDESGAVQQCCHNGEGKNPTDNVELMKTNQSVQPMGYQSNGQMSASAGYAGLKERYQKSAADGTILDNLRQQKDILEKFEYR